MAVPSAAPVALAAGPRSAGAVRSERPIGGPPGASLNASLKPGPGVVEAASPGHRRDAVADLTERVELLAQRRHPHDENRKLVAHLHRNIGALFTFLTDPTIDATSWRAEQGIRPTTVTRKVCGGNRSHRGALTQGRMMTLFRTASQQGIDAVDYLVNLARAPDPTLAAFFT